MKRILNILLFLIILTSCNNEDGENAQNFVTENSNIQEIDYEAYFLKWLNIHELSQKSFIDSTAMFAYELWAYANMLEKKDSLLLWYPSKDSSFYLITNYDKLTNNRFSEDYSDIDLRFLDSKSKKIYIGMMLLDSLNKRKIDHYWYDSNTFYFLEKVIDSRNYVLTKMIMDIDSIWTYETKPRKENK